MQISTLGVHGDSTSSPRHFSFSKNVQAQGVDAGKQIAVAVVVLWAAREFMSALRFAHEANTILALQSVALVRKVSDR
jgi:hypothetical protein